MKNKDSDRPGDASVSDSIR